MDRITSPYKRRLDTASGFIALGLLVLPLALAYALGGPLWAACFLLSVLGLGLWRAGGPDVLTGTFLLQPFEAPGLFVLVESLARRAGLRRMPEIRIVPGGQTNAAATLRGQNTVLIVTEALLARLDTRHLGAVLAHEVCHIAFRDLLLFRVARTLEASTIVLSLLVAVLAGLSILLEPSLTVLWMGLAAVAPLASRWLVAMLSRTREFAADLGAAHLTGDPGALADALELVEYRPRNWWEWWLIRRRARIQEPAKDAFRSHPPTTERVRRLELLARWAS